MNEKLRKKIEKIFAFIGLILIASLFIVMMYAGFVGNKNLILAMFFAIVFVSIIIYIALNILHRHKDIK